MDESQRYNVERKKSDPKDYIQYDSICIKFKKKPNKSTVIEVRRVVTSGSGMSTKREPESPFWGGRHGLYVHLGGKVKNHQAVH